VRRGDPIALSGYSGLDGLVMFPWSVPHVHFNVWLDGAYIDPFAAEGETAMWVHGNAPRPHDGSPEGAFEPTAWDEGAVDAAIEACKEPGVRVELAKERAVDRRAMSTLFQMNYFPARFAVRPRLVRGVHARAPRLTLPFRAEDFEGVALGPR
jgi:murein DD-endopeptidase